MAKNGIVTHDKNRTEQSVKGSQQSRQNSRNTSVEFSEEFCCENDSRESSSCDKK